MSEVSSAAWRAFKITPYGVVLHLPGDWEALPPAPANGPEIMRATGGPDRHVIVFKMPVGGRTAVEVAAAAQERLAAHGYADFARTEVRFAGLPGAMLEFVTRDDKGTITRRTREYFAVRGSAAFALGMGSTAWEERLPLIEEIAARFELAE